MIPLVIHIPHSSTVVAPDELRDFSISPGELRPHIAAMTDHLTDQLFALDGPDVTTVKFPSSRLVVDPERFENDADEPMAVRGQSVLYQRGADGSTIRPVLSKERRQALLDRWYHPHHTRLTAAVDDGLRRHGSVLIIDAHSFPDRPLAMDLDQSTPRPDACIGTSDLHTPPALVTAVSAWCRERLWSLGINNPYAGTIVPLKHYLATKSVWSIMIEINRARYMDLRDGLPITNERFEDTRDFVRGLIIRLRTVASELTDDDIALS